MPPVRTLSTAKPVKTERTHEENQERAYIAASRRSDRSLEARIESARRASEIHKKRTGRALRVTEQDVVNEEMYEEEDDDLPAQYRRLTAHLSTNNIEFNRKLQAYLATHHAGREALYNHAAMSGFGHPYPNAPGFAPQPMLMQQPLYPQQQMMPPQMINRSPSSFRTSPYGMPQSQHIKAQHQRSQSFAAPQEFGYQQPLRNDSLKPEDRRMSLPSQPIRAASDSPTATRSTTIHPDTPEDSAQSTSYGLDAPSPYATSAVSPHSVQPPFEFSPQFTFSPTMQQQNYGPFSMALPPETQQMLGPALDPNDPTTAMFMSNSEMVSQPTSYSYNPNFNPKRLSIPTSQGMHETLAPPHAPLTNINPQNLNFNTPTSSASDDMPSLPSSYTPTMHYYDLSSNFQDTMKPAMTRENSTQGSTGLITPGTEWAKFIDSNMLEDLTAPQ